MSALGKLKRFIRGSIDGGDTAERRGTSTAPAPFVPNGHFFSPAPSFKDIEELEQRAWRVDSFAGVDLNEPGQVALLEELAKFYSSMPFRAEGSPGLRYRFENESYSYADGVFLHAMLRHFRPRRLIEIGSGYSSALTLDTNEHFLDGQLDCTFIEPYPDLLMRLMTGSDRERCRIIPSRLQDVDLALFDALQARDMLFVDSTHVAKANSDVNRVFFEILPRLAPGVLVHVHDVFPSMDYPIEWLRQGRAWNEQYVLRAFLQFNATYKVRLFGSFLVERRPEWFQSHMPLCLKNPGGAFWMERVR